MNTPAQDILEFLESIEGTGYGGMASFEIARQHAREMARASGDAQTAGPCACDWSTGECQGPIGCQAVAEIVRLRGAAQAVGIIPVAWRYKCQDGSEVLMLKRLTDEQKRRGYYTGEEGEDEVDGDEAVVGPFHWAEETPLYALSSTDSAAPPSVALVAAIIERCAKIADPWPGYWIDHSSTEAECAVVAVRTEIAAKIRRYSMTNIINLQFPKCCECGVRATQHIDLVDESGAPAGQKHFCADHGNVLSEIDLCLLIDKKNEEIAQLRQELASLREAHRSTLSRPVSAPIEPAGDSQ
jgi:hypothetical protein